ncbi:hypothetical protein F7734_60295 [Scytonema sp. UIC 10036]|uniref:hypothetical protein n=1 Tax=Scytonema sp. UIC 10036 TaxID=2304196 RepID=UPI0012DA0587|nr:hypothetical protein [Scytonema sp. UIC 10036]MUH01865.1 hypothetical protein [Scytonema sp. UIC 10036]
MNQQIQEHCLDDSALFTEVDLLIIQEAIAATICAYDPDEQAIYQPALYDNENPLSPVARILALADISSLGMEGVDSYNQEGSLLVLEENPDLIPILLNQETKTQAVDNSELLENIRQRLLKRARFQVNFAKSRLKRYPQEVASFPTEVIPILKSNVFRYLTPETIQEIESTTPTSEDTNLEVLVNFFRFKPNP